MNLSLLLVITCLVNYGVAEEPNAVHLIVRDYAVTFSRDGSEILAAAYSVPHATRHLIADTKRTTNYTVTHNGRSFVTGASAVGVLWFRVTADNVRIAVGSIDEGMVNRPEKPICIE